MAEFLLKDKHALRGCFLYEFQLGHSAAVAHRNLCDVTGTDTLKYKMVNFWFHRFKEGDFDLSDKPRSGRHPLEIDESIQKELDEEPGSSVRELSSALGLHKSTVHRHLRASGMEPKFGQLVPHEEKSSEIDMIENKVIKKH